MPADRGGARGAALSEHNDLWLELLLAVGRRDTPAGMHVCMHACTHAQACMLAGASHSQITEARPTYMHAYLHAYVHAWN